MVHGIRDEACGRLAEISIMETVGSALGIRTCHLEDILVHREGPRVM